MSEVKEPRFCVRHQPRPATADRPALEGRPAQGDSLLCGQCHSLFRHALSEIADLWPALRSSRTKRAGGNETGRTSKGSHADVGDFWNPASAIVMLDVEDYVGFLIRLSTPADKRLPRLVSNPDKVVLNLRTIVRYFARFLSHHTELGPSLLSDALEYRAKVKAAIDGVFVRRIALPDALCAAETTADDVFGEEPVLCGGQLVAIIYPEGDTRESKIVCSNDPRHNVPASDWITHLEGLANA